jgi:hypothetical protein
MGKRVAPPTPRTMALNAMAGATVALVLPVAPNGGAHVAATSVESLIAEGKIIDEMMLDTLPL